MEFIEVHGWEDGQQFVKKMHNLDRWTTQSADTVKVQVNDQMNVVISQDPHSSHLGGYVSLFNYIQIIVIIFV